MEKFKIITIFISLVACHSFEKKNANEVFFENQNIEWITDGRPLPANDSLFYLENPSPLFRKEFETDDAIENATLYITAAGYYNAFINGIRIGKKVLDPAWTAYSKRIYFSQYDVTSLINNGNNCLGVTLGNGFYNPLPLKKWGRRNLRNDLIVGKPAFVAKLQINYKNGSSEEILSDSTWKFTYGPIRKNSVYLGVVYDARKEIKGWDIPGFNDSSWMPAKIGKEPGGKLQKSFFPPVQITQEIPPVDISSPRPGVWIVDMGVNFTGIYKIKLSGNEGDTINFRFGERIYDDGKLNPMTSVVGQIKGKGIGGSGAPNIAWQTDSYIIGKEPHTWFQPEFTYHAYRYMEIVGLSEKPKLSDIKGLMLHSNVTNESSFSSSSKLLNSIQEITKRTFLANLISVQSDCPAREKFGYGGDLNATSESFIYNFNMKDFYRKTVYDWVDAMNDSLFVDTAPFAGIKYCGISWESAYLTTQYYLYLYYNDREIIKEFYDLNNQWMDKVAKLHQEGLVRQGLSDHGSMEPVPVELTGTSHYLQCARIMNTFASVMGDKENIEKYAKLTDKLKNLLKSEYWDKPANSNINRQTLFSTLLYHGVVPDNEVEAAKDSLLNAVKNGPSGHFNTGIFGTKYILEALSKYNSPDAVFEIVNSTAYPGWGFMVDNGATTIWETWEESDNTFSNNHPMFGTVTEWYYRWLGGIRPDPENPGFKEFILAPSIPEGLEFINCTYNSPLGKIVSNWKKGKQQGSYTCELVVPDGSKAKVVLPFRPSQKIVVKRKGNVVEFVGTDSLQTGQFALTEGEYMVTVSL